MNTSYSISGNIADVVKGIIFKGIIHVNQGVITSIVASEEVDNQYILPGLIDAHVHIESSMLVPAEFARLAVVHGTVATVSDPHEIANVLGVEGVEYMIDNGKTSPFYFFFGAPSCVPATGFESSGAVVSSEQISKLLHRQEVHYLSEMMNFPGVIFGDADVKSKLEAAHSLNKPIDGHAPGLDEESIEKYAQAGITTDHECSSETEAVLKIKNGMHILIREGSAARNFDALIPLIQRYPEKIMFCSDDKHPDELTQGHINLLIKRAIAAGFNPIDVIRACTLNPVKHYNLPCGLLQEGQSADMIVVNSLNDFIVKATYIKGQLLASEGETLLKTLPYEAPNNFVAQSITTGMLQVPLQAGKLRVIEAFDGELVTGQIHKDPKTKNGFAVSDTEKDILKIVVINRYQQSKPAIGFIHGFGFKSGALASTVAHDSHNIICIGTNDDDMVQAINALVETKGGISISNQDMVSILPLPVAGLMSDKDGYEVGKLYSLINEKAQNLGGKLKAPFMTMSFMALLVIPNLKLSDKGLFDGTKFCFTDLFVA